MAVPANVRVEVPCNSRGSSSTPQYNNSDGKTSSLLQCQKCVRMLQKVLVSSDSRPLHLLKALGASTKQLSFEHDGVIVTLPKQHMCEKMNSNRTWSHLRPPEPSILVESTNHAPVCHQKPVLAIATSPEAQQHPQITDSIKIECRPCSDDGAEGGARAFVAGPDPLSMVICTNRLSCVEEAELSEVLVHELMHIYDVRVYNLDLQQCQNLAYSEVRAAHQAECHNSWLKDFCVKQKAIAATQNLFSSEARECIAKVFEKAMADTTPFPPSDSSKWRNNSAHSSWRSGR